MAEKQQIGRLALRHEGDWWMAYYALSDTMENAIPLGSIRFNGVLGYPERKQAFMDLMRDLVADIIEGKTGQRPSWGGPERAPEHERAGSS